MNEDMTTEERLDRIEMALVQLQIGGQFLGLCVNSALRDHDTHPHWTHDDRPA